MADGSDPKEAIDQLFDYYQLLTPQDLLGNLRTQFKNNSLQIDTLQSVMNVYVDNMVSGRDIVSRLNPGASPTDAQGYAYCTMYQTRSGRNQVVSPTYWSYTKNQNQPKPTLISDLWKEICQAEIPQPAVDATINILRTPLVSLNRRNVNEITTFLNYIPSYFASQMVAYFDVEFQMPYSGIDGPNNNKIFLSNKPSLLRFLEGTVKTYPSSPSEAENFPLTDADRALMQVTSTPTKSDQNARSTFTGMEMFTTPQTLVNMNTLKGDADGKVRLNDAKPFLPPASVTSATIDIANAGAGAFAHKKGKLSIKIHDKARLAEFAELFRGPAGYRDVKVWLTYGWLAPRNRGDDDVYAKFINYNMLVKEAFNIYNSSFKFEVNGEVSVDLDLVSAGMSTLDVTTISDASPVKAQFQNVKNAIEVVRKASEELGLENDSNPFKEIRIFQVLQSTAAGSIEPDIKGTELKTAVKNAQATLGKLTPQSGFTSSQIANINRGLNELVKLFGENKTAKEKIRDSAVDYAAKQFAKCRKGIDPFLPTSDKQKATSGLYNAQLITALTNYNQGTRVKELSTAIKNQEGKTLVSFGKIFSTFCMPALLTSAAADGIDEVQVNFYMLNESCGPVSLCNIAEFPIDIRKFEQQFADYVEQIGGDDMTVEQFVQFVAEYQFSDERSPGYDMFSTYEAFSAKEDEGPKRKGDEQAQSNFMSNWLALYGVFKKPSLAVSIETLESGATTKGKSDLLYTLGKSAASVYQRRNKQANKNIIKRIHIYDKTLNAYYGTSRIFLEGSGPGARAVAIDDKDLQNVRQAVSQVNKTIAVTKKDNKNLSANGTKITATPTEDATSVNVTVQGTLTKPKQGNGRDVPGPTENVPVTKRNLKGGKSILADEIKSTLPVILYGSQGSMIKSADVSSKTDGLQGTINMQGGVKGKPVGLSDSGLSMDVLNLPLQVLPAQLSITSLGCPIAELYQQFFFDFNTGTTLDNLYNCTSLSHKFSPGSFETAWTFVYTDGYGKYRGAPSLKEFFKDVENLNT